MLKQLLVFLFVLILVAGFSLQAQAELFNRGTDTLGNRLIYDSDLNITWYDYTQMYEESGGDKMFWASGLSVNLGGNIYDDWRLPSTVDGNYSFGYDGTTTGGYNITSSEMGHLFYVELGNKGRYDKSGNLTGCSASPIFCLTNKGVFQNLRPGSYWSGTRYSNDTSMVWEFSFGSGGQLLTYDIYDNLYGIAVRPGDVAAAPPVIPEPVSSILFLTGGATLIGRKYIRRKKKEV